MACLCRSNAAGLVMTCPSRDSFVVLEGVIVPSDESASTAIRIISGQWRDRPAVDNAEAVAFQPDQFVPF